MTIAAGSDILAADFVGTSSGAADSGKVAKLDANGKFPEGFTYKQYKSLTASGAIAANDGVYLTAANTVKSIYPTAQGTGASVSTSPSHISSHKDMPLSTGGNYLHIAGGEIGTAAVLYAQVRTINAAETDFSNGSEQTVYSTGNGVNGFDVCQIATDKFLVIYQTNTGGSGAGVKAVVLSVSGTTVTVGTAVTIETTGAVDNLPACCKLDSNKALISYMKDSDGDHYCQVLTVSTTTITTNTAVKVKTTGNGGIRHALGQLGTDSAIMTYSDSNANLYGVTISVSSTTPTVNAEQTIVGTATTYWHQLKPISSTKVLMLYSSSGTPVNDQACILTVSGSTITKGSDLALGSNRNGNSYMGAVFITTKFALVLKSTSDTQFTLYFLDVSGSTPTSTSSQTLSSSIMSGGSHSGSVVKVSPWTYHVSGPQSDSDYIVKMTPSSSNFIGLASAAIADTATGDILHRYRTHTLTGITLTAASKYYIDDDAQPTVNSSLTAPALGIAVNTTDLLIQ